MTNFFILKMMCVPGPRWLGSGHRCFQWVDERGRLLCEWEECSNHSPPAYSSPRRPGSCEAVWDLEGFFWMMQSSQWLIHRSYNLLVGNGGNCETFIFRMWRVCCIWNFLFHHRLLLVVGIQIHPHQKEKTLTLSSLLWRQEERKEGVWNNNFKYRGGCTLGLAFHCVVSTLILCICTGEGVDSKRKS